MKRHVVLLNLVIFSFSLFACAQLKLQGLEGQPITLTLEQLKQIPHHAVTVVNEHSKANEKYDGVLLADLLAKINAPMGDKLRGPLMLAYVEVAATDGYRVMFALPEIDSTYQQNEIILADTVDGKPLSAKTGPLKLIAPQDKHPGRWVWGVTTISLRQAK